MLLIAALNQTTSSNVIFSHPDPPDIKYTVNSTSRGSYQPPAELPEEFRYMIRKSRFGHTPYKTAQGIGNFPYNVGPMGDPNRVGGAG